MEQFYIELLHKQTKMYNIYISINNTQAAKSAKEDIILAIKNLKLLKETNI